MLMLLKPLFIRKITVADLTTMATRTFDFPVWSNTVRAVLSYIFLFFLIVDDFWNRYWSGNWSWSRSLNVKFWLENTWLTSPEHFIE